uniref:Uncharacterized protein n=1 Tax=Romanomermis culicivorax TaxID=13658 RepID=A0A915KUF0_ROMCU
MQYCCNAPKTRDVSISLNLEFNEQSGRQTGCELEKLYQITLKNLLEILIYNNFKKYCLMQSDFSMRAVSFWKKVQTFELKGFLAGAGAVPPLANVRLGVTISTRAQQKWSGSECVDWLKHQSYGCNIIHPYVIHFIQIDWSMMPEEITKTEITTLTGLHRMINGTRSLRHLTTKLEITTLT